MLYFRNMETSESYSRNDKYIIQPTEQEKKSKKAKRLWEISIVMSLLCLLFIFLLWLSPVSPYYLLFRIVTLGVSITALTVSRKSYINSRYKRAALIGFFISLIPLAIVLAFVRIRYGGPGGVTYTVSSNLPDYRYFSHIFKYGLFDYMVEIWTIILRTLYPTALIILSITNLKESIWEKETTDPSYSLRRIKGGFLGVGIWWTLYWLIGFSGLSELSDIAWFVQFFYWLSPLALWWIIILFWTKNKIKIQWTDSSLKKSFFVILGICILITLFVCYSVYAHYPNPWAIENFY